MTHIGANTTYDELSDYQKHCLPATNYWREQNGLPLIEVPANDENFHNNFKKTIQPVDNTVVIRPAPISQPVFSFFFKPVTNVEKSKPVNLIQSYQIIKDPKYLKSETDQARKLYPNKNLYSRYKRENFHYVTFSGQFKKRDESSLISHSGLLCIDIDHITNVDGMRIKLLADDKITTELLFTSPGGNGLKWIVSINVSEGNHREYFFAFEKYVLKKYGYAIDKACKDVSRACFICHDPNVYINPKWL